MSAKCPKCSGPLPDGAFACPRDGTLIFSEDVTVNSARTVIGFDLSQIEEDEDKTLVATTVGRAPRVGTPKPVSSHASSEDVKTTMSTLPLPRGARDPLIGTRVGDYLVESVVGEGGVGLVYRATQTDIGKTVAIKVLRGEVAGRPEEIKRLLDEAKAVNAIRHRGIIDIFGFGKLANGQQYIVMEFLEGAPLDDVIDVRGALPVPEVLEILDEVLTALGAAHKAGVVHRDLKSNNIFQAVHPDGTRYVKLLDFGLAKKGANSGGSVAQTHVHLAVGTPEYIAPEQACGAPVSPQTDLYSLGVVTFELLTGTRPFYSDNPLRLLSMHVEDTPPTLASKGAVVPAALEKLVARMLAKDAKDRPSSAEAVREELALIRKAPGAPVPSAELTEEPPTSPAQEIPSKHRRQGRAARVVAWLVVLSIFGAAGAWLTLRHRSGLPPFEQGGLAERLLKAGR